MRYCVLKNAVTVIDGSKNSEEIMFQNAKNSGFNSSEVEIISETEYKIRLANITPIVPPKTEIELLQQENINLKQSIAELAELIIGGV